MTDSRYAQLRDALAAEGVQAVDEVALARLARLMEQGAPPAERMRAALAALGLRGLDDGSVQEIADTAARCDDGERFVDALFIGPCPACGSQLTRSGEHEPDIDDATVGVCATCGWLWCSECGEALGRSRPECGNPDCFLNRPDDPPPPDLHP